MKTKRCIPLLLALVVLPLARVKAAPEETGTEAPEAGLAIVLEEIRKLSAKVEGLEKTVESLRAEIALLRSQVREAEAPGEGEATPPRPSIASLPEDLRKLLGSLPGSSISGSRNRHRGADLEALARIELPDDPDERAVIRYVDRILELSRSQNSFSSTDPQIHMLAKVGSDHVGLLLDRLVERRSRFEFANENYLVGAINEIATEAHRDRIVKLLSVKPALVEVVDRHGWHGEARYTLISELLNPSNRYLSSEWIAATAKLDDPESSAAMVTAFTAGKDDVEAFYHALRNLPTAELDALVAEMWRARDTRTGFDPNMERAARIAARHGVRSALERVFADLTSLEHWSLREARSTIYRCTNATGTPEELQAWFRENGDSLEFDARKRKWLPPQSAPSQKDGSR